MILIDAFIFILIVIGLHYYKLNHPNFLFFCKGAILFLPPDDQNKKDQKSTQSTTDRPNKINTRKSQNKQKKNEVRNEISILEVEYNHVKSYPFCTQFQRIFMTMAALVIFYLIRAPLSPFLPEISHLTFYVLVTILVYAIKVSVDVFMVTEYKSFTVILFALILNSVYFILYLALNSYQGIYDPTISMVSQDYSKYLQIILGNASPIYFINQYTVLAFVLFINFFITLATIPSVIKFGNWFSKTLKEIYYQQDNQQLNRFANKQTQQNLKQKSRNTISLLKYYLFATLIFIVLSHRFLLSYQVPSLLLDSFRIISFSMTVGIILWTSKDAMQFNGSFAYNHVQEYFKQKSQQKRQLIRRKIVPYIYYIWYHLHQFLIRIAIPTLLLLLVVHWKYFSVDHNIQPSSINQRNHFNYDTQCAVYHDQLSLIKNLYKCPIKSYRQMEEEQFLTDMYIISGKMVAQKTTQPPSHLQTKIITYGLIKTDFMLEITQLLLWYSSVTIYIMTVIYVLLLRKSVYDI